MFQTMDVTEVDIEGIYLLLLKEAVVALLIGLIAYIIVSAIQIAVGFVDFQMGFEIANDIDPQIASQRPLTGHIFT